MEVSKSEVFTEKDKLEVTSFSVHGLVMKGKFVSIDDRNNVTIELENGTRVIFKKDNLKKLEK